METVLMTRYEPSKISFGAYSVLEPSMGEIAELLVFDSVLPTGDRQKMEGYLAYKWGLTNSIPDDHPYKTGSEFTGSDHCCISRAKNQ